jgi:L-galactonate dehydratase
MNAAGDYSAAYCILHTDGKHEGHGMVRLRYLLVGDEKFMCLFFVSFLQADNPCICYICYAFSPSHFQSSSHLFSPLKPPTHTSQTFTIGRGNEIVCYAISHLVDRIKGRTLDSLVQDWGKTWRHLVNDSQLRWIGPEKGVIHLALGAVVNAIWDLWAKELGKPVWRIVADMTPQQIVQLIDFRYITDALTPEEALEILTKAETGKKERLEEALNSQAVPAYTTSAGWLGYGKEKMKGLLQETLDKGYRHFKLKVGSDVAQDRERLTIAREVIGYDKGNVLMVDANQVWSVPEAIEYMKQLAEFKPWFIEEPTSPDDGMSELFPHDIVLTH